MVVKIIFVPSLGLISANIGLIPRYLILDNKIQWQPNLDLNSCGENKNITTFYDYWKKII